MDSPRTAWWRSAVRAALLLGLASSTAPPTLGATTAKPGPPPVPVARSAPVLEQASGPGETRRETEFFDRWTGGPLDGKRYVEMWNAARAQRSEPAPTAVNAVNTWQLVGPLYSVNVGGGNMTGRVRDIDAHNVRVLAASGGLWRFNVGAIAMTDSVPSTWFGSFATSPFDANTILLGTGEYKFGPSGTGVYKTTDGGATWVHKTMNPPPSSFSRIRYSPDGAVVHAVTDQGYYRSTNGGETWMRTLGGPATDLSTVNGDPNLVYVTLANYGLWQSVDAGLNWTQVVGGGIPGALTGDGAVSAIRTGRSGTVWIYVCFETAVYRSTDSGVSWTDITPSHTVGNSTYGPVISVCPGDPNIVLMGNAPYNRTADAGAHWTEIQSVHLHADYHVFAWDDDGVGVWAGNDGGWSHSPDSGLTWDSSSNVMPISQFYTIDCEKTEVGYMVGGTQDNNVLFTPNEALFWSDPALTSTEGDAFGVCIDQYNPSHMWAISGESNGNYVFPRYHTMDGGASWQQVNNGIAPNGYSGFIRTDNAFPVRLVTSAGTFVYESLDGGSTWSQANAGFPYPINNLTSSTRVAPNSVLYACLIGSNPGQRLYVRDGGSWYERSAGLPPGTVWKVIPHPWAAYADEAWAIVNQGRMFHTTNRGLTWTDITGDFPYTSPVGDLVPNPYNTSELYVGTYLGCYRTKNGGVNWERWNNGMPPSAKVTEMAYIDLTPSGGHFYVVAATYGRSVWKRDISGDDPQPSLTVGNRTGAEGNSGPTIFSFPVTLSAPQPRVVTVDYSTMDGTATVADQDYVSASGTLVFSPGQTTSWIYVTVNGDTQIEPDETFSVVLSNPLRATIANSGVGTIQDDDAHGMICQNLYVTDGGVSAMVKSGNTLYIGGSFRTVGPATGTAVPIDAASGLPVWLPKVAGYVYAVAPDGSGGWYLGGSFTHVGGLPRTNLAHILADHTVAAWNPVANDIVLALAVSGTTVYAGGRFTSIGPYARFDLAAIDGLSGEATAWNPNPNDVVTCIVASGGTVYVSGDFTTIGGQSRARIAALSSPTGLASSWNPAANAEVATLALSGSIVYAGGSFTSIGTQPRSYLAALDASSGIATGWDPEPDGYVFTLAVSGSTVYAGGVFANVHGSPARGIAAIDAGSGIPTPWTPNSDGDVTTIAVSGSTVYAGGSFTTIGGQARSSLAALDAGSGLATPWNPNPNSGVGALAVNGGTVMVAGIFSSLAAQPRNSIAALDVVTGQVTPWNPNSDGYVYTLAASGGTVYAGGGFTNIGGQTRNRIAALDAATGLATAWDPNANGPVRTLVVSGTTVYAGGEFTSIGTGSPTRNRIAALDISAGSTGTALSFNPNANGTVNAIATYGTTVFAGGQFSSIGGLPRNGLAWLNGINGAASPTWNPSPNAPVNALALDLGFLYVGGSFTMIGGLARYRLAALTSTGVGAWSPGANNTVYALAPDGSGSIYVGGAFTAIGGELRQYLAVLHTGANTAASWAPDPDAAVSALAVDGSTVYAGGGFTSVGGLPQSHVACMIPIGLVDVPRSEPTAEFALRMGPNPTSGRVRIEYTLPEAARVRLVVYDVQGRQVARLSDEVQQAGPHETRWDGTGGWRGAQPGLYFVRFEAGAHRVIKRLVVVR